MEQAEEKKDFEVLSDDFDMLMDSYEQLERITSKAEVTSGEEVRNDSILVVLNQRLTEWGYDAVSKVRHLESLVEILLEENKRKAEQPKAA